MKIYHVTTEAKAKKYRQAGRIHKPVRGFDTLIGATVWAMKVGRKVIYEVTCNNIHKLPDHHNIFGNAYWIDNDALAEDIKCIISPKT